MFNIIGKFHILEVDPWTQTLISDDIGTFSVSLLTYVPIETHTKLVPRTLSEKYAVIWIGIYSRKYS